MSLRRYRASSRRGRRAVERLLKRGRSQLDRATRRAARRLVRAVQKDGDPALLRAVARFDGHAVKRVGELVVRPEPIPAAELPPDFEPALERAIAAVEEFHQRQSEALRGFSIERGGISLLERLEPFRRVGLYVPGGRFPYPSSVLMAAIPARAAGVGQIVVATPPGAWQRSPALRHAAHRLRIDEVWTIGGAQAIAALAYGTKTLAPVELVAGPGNVFVAAAKRLVARDVGTDREAGPSEVVIIAGDDAPPALVAADLLAQAEHDPKAMAVVLTTSRRQSRRIAAAVGQQIEALPTQEIARQSLAALSCALHCETLDEAISLAERIAPEHLQLIGAEVEARADEPRAAGAIFVGAATPTAFGDYIAGPSHVLPTGGAARFGSGLGVADFVRRWHVARFSDEAAADAAGDVATLAEVEGLAAHAASARRREAASDSEPEEQDHAATPESPDPEEPTP